jgi:RHS repeat-associated protein
LSGATLADGTTVSNTYDANGRRVRQTTGAATTNSVWDETSQYGDVVAETNGAGAAQATYLVANGDRLSQSRGGAVSTYLHDGQGSVRALTDASGAITDRYAYDAFGAVISQSGSTPNAYGYNGQQTDSGSNLLYLRARYDDPSSGRFLSRDRAGLDPRQPSQINRYVYAANNPTTWSDPSGNEVAIEYGMVVDRISIRQAAVIAAIGAAVACLFMRVASVVMAVNHDAAGLLALQRTAPPQCYLPLQKVDPLSIPTIAAHVQAAQNAGQPMLLVYLGPNNPLRDLNRAAACPPSVRRARRPLSCDEYPYASTANGGPGASTAPVPPSEQNSQGGLLGGFYGSFHPYYGRPMRIGDHFAAIVDADP